MSEPGPSAGDASSNNSENEIRILKRKLAAAEDEKKQLEFQMAEKKSKSTFQDYLLEGETLHVSARRRLRFQNKKVTYKVNATIKNIVAEAEVYLSDEVKKTLNEISGQNWPSNITSCHDYNTGGCTLQFSHEPRRMNKSNDFLLLHVCSICLELYSLAVFHSGRGSNTFMIP